MKKINAYETSDGIIFHDRKEARTHQNEVDVFEALHAAADFGFFEIQTPEDLGHWLCANSNVLVDALKGVKPTAPVAEPELAPSEEGEIALAL